MDKTDNQIKIPDEILQTWQSIIDTIADLISVPSALIMRVVDQNIEVFVSSKSEGNPYAKGDQEKFNNSGLYCERVVKSQKKLLIPNALKDKEWENNPDVKLNMISYMGLPLMFPDKTPFGTICVLDNKENHYSESYSKLLHHFRDSIQHNLALVYMNHTMGEVNRSLEDYIKELKVLRGIVPVCCSCSKIRDNEGQWHVMEEYIEQHSEAQFTHCICNSCKEKLYGK